MRVHVYDETFTTLLEISINCGLFISSYGQETKNLLLSPHEMLKLPWVTKQWQYSDIGHAKNLSKAMAVGSSDCMTLLQKHDGFTKRLSTFRTILEKW